MEQNEKDYEFMLKVKEAYEASSERGDNSIRAVSLSLGLSRTKVRKILVTLGAIQSEITETAMKLKSQGLTIGQIADEMGVSMATVSTYLPYDTILYNGEEKSYNAIILERYRKRNKNNLGAQVHHSNKNTTIYEEKDMRERENKIYKLRLTLNTDGADMSVLQKYGKVKDGISRDILVSSDMTLHALHYAIQRLFGWQNSHLHHFELPQETFEELTGNRFDRWSDLCGIYFRFPSEDMEDLYWDDNYRGESSIKTWFRKKYTGPYQYHGTSEHFMEARYAVSDFVQNNEQISVMPPFDVWMTMSEEERKPINKKLCDITCDELAMFFGGSGCGELLERLRISDLFAKDEVEPLPNQFVVDKLLQFRENYREFAALHNAMEDGDDREYWRRMNRINGTTPPITKTLIYQYDYGDGWEVRIDMVDMYYSDSEWDHPNKAGLVLVGVYNEQVYDNQTPLYRNSEIIEDEVLADQIRTMVTNGRPLCIAADGLPVLDDVGGIGGYCDFLLALHGKDNGNSPFESAEQAKEWASGMGWRNRMNQPEKIL